MNDSKRDNLPGSMVKTDFSNEETAEIDGTRRDQINYALTSSANKIFNNLMGRDLLALLPCERQQTDVHLLITRKEKRKTLYISVKML